jgi:predicted ester cyclase
MGFLQPYSVTRELKWNPEAAMKSASEEFAIRWFDEVWNQKRREAIGEMLAPDAAIHDGGEIVYGPDGFYPFFDRLHAAFSEMRVEVQDTIAQGDMVCVRWSSTVKHTGSAMGMDPTGKTLETTGISIIRVVDGKAVEAWQNWDMLGLLQQIQEAKRPAVYLTASA